MTGTPPIDVAALSAEVAAAVDGAVWEPVGRGVERVWRLRWVDDTETMLDADHVVRTSGRKAAMPDPVSSGAPPPLTAAPSAHTTDLPADRFCKMSGPTPIERSALAGEANRLRWLREPAATLDLPVAPIVAFDPGGNDHPAVLVTDALDGVPELAWFFDGAVAVEILGRTLRQVHKLPVDACPFDAGPADILDIARARIEAGLVERGDLALPFRRYEPSEMLAKIAAIEPAPASGQDRVVVHGNWSVTNVLLDPESGRCTGIVGWGRAGVGDRHADLAVAIASIVANFGPDVVPLFLTAYGVEHPNAMRLDYYSLLDQLT